MAHVKSAIETDASSAPDSSPLPLMARRRRDGCAFILLLVAVGSVLFHIYSPWWWTPIATNWRYIDDTISITFWITGWFSRGDRVMAYCVFRFITRRKAGGLQSRKQSSNGGSP
jgi:hypothetical protein